MLISGTKFGFWYWGLNLLFFQWLYFVCTGNLFCFRLFFYSEIINQIRIFIYFYNWLSGSYSSSNFWTYWVFQFLLYFQTILLSLKCILLLGFWLLKSFPLSQASLCLSGFIASLGMNWFFKTIYSKVSCVQLGFCVIWL